MEVLKTANNVIIYGKKFIFILLTSSKTMWLFQRAGFFQPNRAF